MKRGYSRFIKLIDFVGDISLLNCCFIMAFFYKKPLIGSDFDDHYIFLHIVFNLVWLIIVLSLDIYTIHRTTRTENVVWRSIQSIVMHALIVFTFIAAIKGYQYSRAHLLLTYIFFSFALLLWRLLFFYTLKKYRQKGSNFRNVIIVGAGAVGNQMYSYFISNNTHGYKFLGFFDDNPEKCLHQELILGPVSALRNFIEKERVDEIFCALPLNTAKTIKELMSFADNNLIRFKIVPDFRGFLNKKVNIDFYNMVPVLTLRPEPMENIMNRAIKRGFDIAFSFLIILLVFTWLFPIFALIIKLTSPGPIFFIQKRSGRRNQVFPCYKFRSMAVNKEADRLQATIGDERITAFGKFLRKTNMDELPQFFNVLIGNMSIVGPRPHMLLHTEEYSKIIDKFMVRHLVKPGITGWAQVNGYRGATQDVKKMLKRVRYDVWYIENWTFFLDIQIIILTAVNMLRGDKNAV